MPRSDDTPAPRKRACPKCKTALAIPDDAEKVRCTVCGAVIRLRVPVEISYSDQSGESSSFQEERDNDDPMPDRVHGKRFPLPKLLIIGAWIASIFATLLVLLIWFFVMRKSESAITESAASAAASTALIGIYTLTRAVTEILDTAQRFGNRS